MWIKNLSALFFVPFVAAAIHNVDVGKSGLTFSKNTLAAAAGDKVNFHFYPGGHAVSESTPSSPCVPSSSSAFFSGYFTQSSGVAKKMFQITIPDTDPIYVYCPQDHHCEFGMVMVINGNTSDYTAYKKAASKVSDSKAPSKVQGGKLLPNKGS